MMSKIYKILASFRDCFSRQIPFEYFCTVILSFMVVTVPMGITSIVRDLFLKPSTYDALLHFFKSRAYSIGDICNQWARIVEGHPQCLRYKGCNIMVGDHTKIGKEGRRMAGCKAIHQDSENFNKAPTIFGHHFGSLGLLIGSFSKPYCSLVHSRIHEGTEKMQEWLGREALGRAARLVGDAIEVAKNLKRGSYLLLDRDFWSVQAISEAVEHNKAHKSKLHIIGRTKNRVCSRRKLTKEEKAENRKLQKRGRPREYTPAVYLDEWFKTRIDEFKTAVLIGGEKVRYLTADMPWHGLVLRFVLSVTPDGKESIFYSTDFGLAGLEILNLYQLRFKIEEAFNGLKHIVNGFSYRFWVKDFEKLSKFNSKTRLENLSDSLKRRLVNCIDRIERLVNFAGVALGILQIMVLETGEEFTQNVQNLFFQRTYSSDGSLTVGQLKTFISQVFPLCLQQEPDCPLTLIIRKFQTGVQVSDFFDLAA